jgi:large subunit ribosomal protein L22
MSTKNKQIKPEHVAKASTKNAPVSTKHCIELCRWLRYKNTSEAKKMLEEVIGLKRAVPYRKFVRDIGHRAGMSTGRFPQKASKEMLKLVKSVEANAQGKGLDISNLKIIKILANRAPTPFTGSRHRHGTKRSHIEMEVMERRSKSKDVKEKKEDKKNNQSHPASTGIKANVNEKPKNKPQSQDKVQEHKVQHQHQEKTKAQHTSPQV